MRDLIVEEGVRSDGRGLKDVRPISSSCGLLPRTHGSTLFTRGETQAIAVTTLGTLLTHHIICHNIVDRENLKKCLSIVLAPKYALILDFDW